MRAFLLLLGLVSGALGHGHLAYPAKAIIDSAASNGAVGSVVVQGGTVVTTLDLTSFNYAAAGLIAGDCNPTNSPNGISYHIHTKYMHTGKSGSGTTECGPANTGGHYDPWYACGSASEHQGVGNACNLGCVQRTYNCNYTNFMADPFSCEVGDWSNKYGGLMETTTNSNMFVGNTTANRFEITSQELYATMRSVVFHCNGKRVLCAPFAADNSTGMKPKGAAPIGIDAALTAGKRMVADFGTAQMGPALELGGGQLRMDGPSISKLLKYVKACGPIASAKFAVVINAGMWNNTAMGGDAASSTTGACASTALGGVLDPGVRCVPGSSMSFAQVPLCAYNATSGSNARCPAFMSPLSPIPVNYTADLPKSTYNAAQGTILIDPALFLGGNLAAGATVDFPYLDERNLLGKSISVVCLDMPLKGWCAKIQAMPPNYMFAGRTMSPTSSPSASPVPGVSVSPTKSPVAAATTGKASEFKTTALWIGVGAFAVVFGRF